MFSTNHLSIESVREGEKIVGKVEGAFDWATGKKEEVPKLQLSGESNAGAQSQTKFTLTGMFSLDEDLDIFRYGIGRLKHIIRTRTAAGNTLALFGEKTHKDIEIELTYIDEEGKSAIENIPYTYDGPENYIKPNVSFADRQTNLANRNDRVVRGKAVHSTGKCLTDSGKELKYYYFVCSRTKFFEMSKEIIGVTDEKDFVRGGIYLSTKTMPTGIQIQPPAFGKEGYWYNIYIIFEYDELKLDPGRKSVPGRITSMVRKQAINIYNELKNHFGDILDQEDEIEVDLAASQEIDEMWDYLSDNVHDLNFDDLHYHKEPEGEQGVVAIFYELIGKGILTGYHTWRNSTRDTYDAYVKYRKDPSANTNKIILEFKHEASDVIVDIRSHKKEYSKIKLLVCWNIDRKKFTDEGFSVRQYQPDDQRFFHGSTHEISVNVGTPIEVICPKTFLEDLKAKARS